MARTKRDRVQPAGVDEQVAAGARPRIYTVGHSTRSFDEFATLLDAHGIRQLADIRTIPRSRRHPQFERDSLARSLRARGTEYRHFPALGGLRRPRRDSPNTGWRNESFRGYADYMGTDEFRAAVDDLVAFAGATPTAVMCAEAVWWRCHRRLLADALVVRGVDVLHVTSAGPPAPHRMNPMARLVGGRLVYPSLC
jgi:uncharacterized protein (DUF488 family)